MALEDAEEQSVGHLAVVHDHVLLSLSLAIVFLVIAVVHVFILFNRLLPRHFAVLRRDEEDLVEDERARHWCEVVQQHLIEVAYVARLGQAELCVRIVLRQVLDER